MAKYDNNWKQPYKLQFRVIMMITIFNFDSDMSAGQQTLLDISKLGLLQNHPILKDAFCDGEDSE